MAFCSHCNRVVQKEDQTCPECQTALALSPKRVESPSKRTAPASVEGVPREKRWARIGCLLAALIAPFCVAAFPQGKSITMMDYVLLGLLWSVFAGFFAALWGFALGRMVDRFS